MCWNDRVSLTTFIIGAVVCYTLFKRNKPYDKVIGIFILFYSGIQFCEYLMWKSIKQNDPKLNSLATKLVYINLYGHAAVVGYMLYLETGNSLYFKLGLIPFIYGMITMPKFRDDIFISKPKDSRHLAWDFDNRFYVVVSLIIFYSFYSIPSLRPMSLFFLITYIISFIGKNDSSSASLWCFYSAIFSGYALIR